MRCKERGDDVRRNCDGRSKSFVWVTKLGAKFTRCPKSWALTEARWAFDVIRDRAWLEKCGELPKQGGLLKQDPKWIETVELIDYEIELLRKAASDGAQSIDNRDKSRRSGKR